MRDLLRRGLLLCAVAAAAVAAGWIGRSARLALAAPVSTLPRVSVPDSLLPAGGPMGSGGTIRILEFTDHQCPFSARGHAALRDVVIRAGGRVSVERRHLPLSGHRQAFGAALATACARAQGRGEAYHHLLFAHRDSLGTTAWDAFAARAGVTDLPRYRRCVAEAWLAPQVEADIALARSLGIEGTPAYVVDGRRVTGARSAEEWERLLRAAGRSPGRSRPP